MDCSVCGSCKDITRHHIQPRGAGGNNSKRNLVILCEQCHALVERFYWMRLSFRSPNAAHCIKTITLAVLDGRIPQDKMKLASARQREAWDVLRGANVHWPNLYKQAVRWIATIEPTKSVPLGRALIEPPWWRKRSR